MLSFKIESFLSQKDQIENTFISNDCKELTFNPKYEDLWAPRFGPDNPHVSDFHKSVKNTLTGFVEAASVNEFQFENQRKTFIAKGFAYDPSTDAVNNKLIVASYCTEKKENLGKHIFTT
jgi:pre-mRNA-processing factor 17